MTLGAGSGKNIPATNNADFYFAGAIDEFALYRHTVGALAATQHFQAGRPIDVLTEIHNAQDNRRFATLTHDVGNDRVSTLTDQLGRVWTLDTPKAQDSVRTSTLRGPPGYGDWTYTSDTDSG